jgi:hypothetical protein
MLGRETNMRKSTANDVERRRAKRQRPKPSTAASCRPEDTVYVGANVDAKVLDISADGIRLTVDLPLEKGQKIEIDLDGIGYCRTLKLNAEVVWSLRTAAGTWCIGAKF